MNSRRCPFLEEVGMTFPSLEACVFRYPDEMQSGASANYKGLNKREREKFGLRNAYQS